MAYFAGSTEVRQLVGVGEATSDRMRSGQRVVAVDVPSGIGTDDGTVPGPVLDCDLTVTMGAHVRGEGLAQRAARPDPDESVDPHVGPAGLLDAETNLTYGIKYLAGAWRVSGGSHDRAVSHYARGYYYEAKRKGLLKATGLR